jgi:hypothetical protein
MDTTAGGDQQAGVSWQPPPETDDMLAMLGVLDLFQMLSYSQLKFLLAMGKVRRLEQSEYLFQAGDAPDSLGLDDIQHPLLSGPLFGCQSTVQ